MDGFICLTDRTDEKKIKSHVILLIKEILFGTKIPDSGQENYAICLFVSVNKMK